MSDAPHPPRPRRRRAPYVILGVGLAILLLAIGSFLFMMWSLSRLDGDEIGRRFVAAVRREGLGIGDDHRLKLLPGRDADSVGGFRIVGKDGKVDFEYRDGRDSGIRLLVGEDSVELETETALPDWLPVPEGYRALSPALSSEKDGSRRIGAVRRPRRCSWHDHSYVFDPRRTQVPDRPASERSERHRQPRPPPPRTTNAGE